MNLKEWVEQSFSTSVNAAAIAAGIQPSTLFRQIEKGQISAENVILLCRAFDKSPANGLKETGYLEPEDFEQAGIDKALSHATNQQIIEEIVRRLDAGTGAIFEQPAQVQSSRPNNVDHEANIRAINDRTVQFAAQESTEPLEQHWT